MDKNRFPDFSSPARAWLTVFLLLTIPATLLSTRAGLSISMILFGGIALIGHSPRRWLSNRWWLLGAAWVALYAFSFFWSEDKRQWGETLSVKLPILLLPLSFGLLPRLRYGQLKILVAGISIFLLSGIGYSMAVFLADPHSAIEGYGISHVMRTPLYNSHIHFSAAVACGIILLVSAKPLFRRSTERILVNLALLLFVAYLHVLASKTGLLMLYLFAFLLAMRSAFRGSWFKAAGLLVLCFCVLWAAITYVPTLHKRVGYITYSWQQMLEGKRDGTYSDIGRLISWHVASNIIAEHPMSGAGAGDLLLAMREEYQQTYPEVAPENHLVPHNQMLCVALAAGLPAVFFFLWWLLRPLVFFRKKSRERFYHRAMWLALLVPLLVEPFLEVQAGVAVYLYFLLSGQYLLRCLAASHDAGAGSTVKGDYSHDQLYSDFSPQGGGVSG